MRFVAVTVLSVAVSLSTLEAGADAPTDGPGLPLLVQEDFEHGSDRWAPTDPAAWQIVASRRGHAFSLFKQSKFKPPHRSPLNFALLKGFDVADFDLAADVLSTKPDYNHRDMCMVFGYQDPAHFYYVHFGKKADDRANQIFIVNGADRRKISSKSTPGTPWDERWHHASVVRRVEDGTIRVYFDDTKNPAMEARDTTFTHGLVGIGSFDDIGDWDDVTLSGRVVQKP